MDRQQSNALSGGECEHRYNREMNLSVHRGKARIERKEKIILELQLVKNTS